jgi:PAS domain S-box-containing protein
VLLVEDDEDDYVLTRTRLANAEGVLFELDWVRTYDAALEAIRCNQHDVYLIDYRLGGRNGLELLREAIAFGCEAPLILLTGIGDQAVDVEAMQVGAADYLIKDQISAPLLARSIRHALERGRILAALRMSERRFRVLFDQTFQLIELLNPDGIVLEVNQRVLDFAQAAAAEIIGLPIWQFPLRGARGTSDRLRMAVAETAAGKHTRCEIELFSPTEAIITLDLSLKPVRDETGQVTLIIAEGRDITARKDMEAALAHERDLMQALMDNIPDTIYFKDSASRFTRINRAQARHLGVADPSDAIGKTDFDFQPSDLAQGFFDEEQQLFERKQPIVNRVEFNPTPDGQPRWLSATKVPLTDADGQVIGMVGVSRDITANKQVEARLAASLHEKEVLLKEIYHRVKNNLQVISSLLGLQADMLADPQVRDLFLENRQRVRSMALVHEKLYQSADLAQIDFASYVASLTQSLQRAYYRSDAAIQVRLEVAPVALDIDRAMPCGLLISELVTNSFKYAFPTGAGGTIWVTLAPTDQGFLQLVVGDNGVGLPADRDPATADSMGWQLVQALPRQLRGTLRCGRQAGTIFTITFPGPEKNTMESADNADRRG